jgi:hypothetical protein
MALCGAPLNIGVAQLIPLVYNDLSIVKNQKH